MTTISVTSLDKYQHYKDRHMVWFKWYIDTLQDEAFMELSEKDRWVFIGLVCLACKTGNKIAHNEKWLERTLNTSNIKKSLENLVCIGMIASCYQDAIPIREDKRREEKSIYETEKVKHLEFVNLTPEEYLKLKDCFGDGGAEERIRKLNDYIGSKGKQYKSHYHTIMMWASKEGFKPKENRIDKVKELEDRAAKQLGVKPI